MSFTIKFVDTPYSCVARENQTILQAAEEAGLQIPCACRCGSCGSCKGKIISGQINYGEYKSFALKEDEKNNGYALMCTATPLTDVEVKVSSVKKLNDERKCKVKVVEKESLIDDVVRLVVEKEDGSTFKFKAGQIFDFLLPGNQRRSYSIASSQNETKTMEFLIRKVPYGLFSSFLFSDAIKPGFILNAEGPSGSFIFESPKGRKTIFLATGTGISSIKSIISTLIENNDLEGRDIYMYWGARYAKDLFYNDLFTQWAADHPEIHYIPVVSREADWKGVKGHIHQQAAVDHGDMTDVDVYACGSNSMITSAYNFLTARCGLKEENFHCDNFGG